MEPICLPCPPEVKFTASDPLPDSMCPCPEEHVKVEAFRKTFTKRTIETDCFGGMIQQMCDSFLCGEIRAC